MTDIKTLQIEVLEAQRVLTTKQYNLRLAQIDEQILRLQEPVEQPVEQPA